MSAGVKWLLLEGVAPLLGATILFSIWTGCRYLATSDTSTFSNFKRGAIDPLGWLYGGIVIATQAGWRSIELESSQAFWCFFAAGACLLVLLAAMTERVAKPNWEPKGTLLCTSLILVSVIFWAGYESAVALAKTPQPQNSEAVESN